MKKYLLSEFTFSNFQEMISECKDEENRQIRADKEGYIFLSEEFVGNENLRDIKFRLPTMSGDYFSQVDSDYMKSIYELIIRNKDNTGYIDPEID